MTLSARLVRQSGAVVLTAWGERLSWGRGYVVHVRRLEASLPPDPAGAAAVINAAMERLVLECPGQYLWGYARYKQPRRET
jgi:KDO2-lipid IV(A) lauroyltransferase